MRVRDVAFVWARATATAAALCGLALILTSNVDAPRQIVSKNLLAGSAITLSAWVVQRQYFDVARHARRVAFHITLWRLRSLIFGPG